MIWIAIIAIISAVFILGLCVDRERWKNDADFYKMLYLGSQEINDALAKRIEQLRPYEISYVNLRDESIRELVDAIKHRFGNNTLIRREDLWEFIDEATKRMKEEV